MPVIGTNYCGICFSFHLKYKNRIINFSESEAVSAAGLVAKGMREG